MIEKTMVLAVIIAVGLMLMSGCMGTYQTARVVPLRVGGFYFTTIDNNDYSALPGIIVEGGWPAGPARFGIGLNLRLIGGIGDDDDFGFFPVWGGKLQIPQNSIADVAVGIDVWGIYPGELKLFISRRFGIFEPYSCIAGANFLDLNDNDNNNFDLFGDGVFSYTFGMMIELGRETGWVLAAELEGGDVWESPGLGIAVLKEF